MTTALLVMALLTTPTPTADTFAAGSCTSYSWSRPPDHIRVKRAHHRGSSIPARVQSIPIDTYVGRVMASGAWGNRVRESAKIGALAIRQYAVWMVLHTCRSWHGKRYDLTDSEMYYTDRRVPTRTAQVVRIMAPVTLTKRGRHFRTGWSGGSGIDGWHANEDTVRGLALSGLGWRRIVDRIYSPHECIVGDWND